MSAFSTIVSRPLLIEWPTGNRPLHPAEIAFFEYPSGRQIFSVTDMVLRASAGNDPIVAELTMIVDSDYQPILGDMKSIPEEAFLADGCVRTDVFLWTVVGMQASGA